MRSRFYLLAAALGVIPAAGLLLSRSTGARAEQSGREPEAPRAGGRSQGASVPPATALAPLGDGSAVYADGAGRFFVLRAAPEGLTLSAVLALRFDRLRFADALERRSDHGYYLDDLAAEATHALERARAEFVRETRSRAVDTGANARARDVLACGDATLLIGSLVDRSYVARRAAALVLGEHGFTAARPVLEEVASEREGDGASRARTILERLPQAPSPGAPPK